MQYFLPVELFPTIGRLLREYQHSLGALNVSCIQFNPSLLT